MWYQLTPDNIKRFHGTDKFDPEMFRSFVEVNGFTRYTQPGDQDWKRFLKHGRDTYGFPHLITECPPEMDHARAFKNTLTNTICLTYQPYNDTDDTRSVAVRWATSRGLEVEVYDPSFSWYYPRSTCLVIIHLPGVTISLK